MTSRTNAGVNRDRQAQLARVLRLRPSAAGRALVSAASPTEQRTNLGLGSAAVASDAAFAPAVHTHGPLAHLDESDTAADGSIAIREGGAWVLLGPAGLGTFTLTSIDNVIQWQ